VRKFIIVDGIAVALATATVAVAASLMIMTSAIILRATFVKATP